MPTMTNIEKDAYSKALEGRSGFDLSDHTEHGILELCPVALDGMYWRIDENNVFSKITGATTFGDGTTPLADFTFAHRPNATGSFTFYIDGVPTVKTSIQTIQLQQTADKQIITYAKATGLLHFASDTNEAIMDDAIVAVVTGNPTIQQKIIFANERHGTVMDPATHLKMHETGGADYGSGLAINGMVDNGAIFTSIDAGSLWDEDLHHTIEAVTAAPFAYRDATGDWTLEFSGSDVVTTNALAFTNGTAADALYNLDNGDGSWSLIDTGLDYVIMHIFATNDGEFPIMKVVGQNLYADRTSARQRLEGEMIRFQEGNLPTPEFLHLYSYILDGAGVIETGLDTEIYIDFRSHYPVDRFE